MMSGTSWGFGWGEAELLPLYSLSVSGNFHLRFAECALNRRQCNSTDASFPHRGSLFFPGFRGTRNCLHSPPHFALMHLRNLKFPDFVRVFFQGSWRLSSHEPAEEKAVGTSLMSPHERFVPPVLRFVFRSTIPHSARRTPPLWFACSSNRETPRPRHFPLSPLSAFAFL